MDKNEKLFEPLYQELHDSINRYIKCLTTLVPVKGNRYDDEDIKLMVVGRALNGWEENYAEDREEYFKQRTDELSKQDRFVKDKWIEKETGRPFWNYTKSILEKLKKGELETDWYQSILWSELYPVSYSEGGNPSELLKYIQFDTAKKLLETQIKVYEPTHVLIMTDWEGWFSLKEKNNPEKSNQFLPHIKPKTNSERNKFIKGSGFFEKSRVVVTCRPEFNNKEKFVEAVVEAFSSL